LSICALLTVASHAWQPGQRLQDLSTPGMHIIRPMGLVALTFILVSVSNARNAFWEDPSGNSMFDPYEFVPAPRTPVESWERDRECDADYFEFMRAITQPSARYDFFRNTGGVIPTSYVGLFRRVVLHCQAPKPLWKESLLVERGLISP